MKFYYEAFTTRGEPKKGEVEAKTEEHAAGIIRNDLGLIAREISSQPLGEFKFDHRAVNTSQEVKPYDPDDPQVEGLRLNPTPKSPPKEPEAPEVTETEDKEITRESFLARDLTRISEVTRQMEAWAKVGKELKKGDELPSGHPAVGGAIWLIYGQRREQIVSGLIRAAMERAVGL